MTRHLLLVALIAGVALGLATTAQADFTYIDTDGSSMNEWYGGSLTPVSDGGNDYVRLDIVDGGDDYGTHRGGYTYGPGKTLLAQGFTSLVLSVDVFVDLSTVTPGTPSTWTLETNLRSPDSVFYGEFDYFGRWLEDTDDLDGDGDTTDWIYKLGRNNDWRTAPTVVESSGWYTFETTWTDDGSEISNVNRIFRDGSLLFEGSSVQSPWASNPGGYETGYLFFYGRDSSDATLCVDNISYSYDGEPVPEPGAIALLGLGAGALALRRRKQ